MRVKIVDWAVIKINFQSHYSGKNFFTRSDFLPRYIRPQKYPNDDDVGMSNSDSINGSKLLTANLIFFPRMQLSLFWLVPVVIWFLSSKKGGRDPLLWCFFLVST